MRAMRGARSQFRARQSPSAALVRSFRPAISSGSGPVLKLKHVLPCMRFFRAGEMFFASTGHI